jgi:hypothetical protein
VLVQGVERMPLLFGVVVPIVVSILHTAEAV